MNQQSPLATDENNNEHEKSQLAPTKRKRGLDEDETSFLESLASPNFEELARQFPDFGRAWKDVVQRQKQGDGGPLQSFITQEFSVALTKALLHVHWGLSVTNVPVEHLCPPVPNRYFYVRWIQHELLPFITMRHKVYFDETEDDLMYKTRQEKKTTTGLDIGVGATCIYPLLMAASFKNELHMFATDIEDESIESASENVRSNSLQQTIEVIKVPLTDNQQQTKSISDSVNGDDSLYRIGPLRQSLASINDINNTKRQDPLDFCMTNPPFYDSENPDEVAEMTQPRSGDGRSRTNMKTSEGSYPGGEVGFVTDMIIDGLYLFLQGQQQQQETQELQTTTHLLLPPFWNSCMCGKKTSFMKLRHTVEQLFGFSHVKTAEFGPGHMTRWFLAWTFERPQARSLLAKIDTNEWGFTVPLTGFNDSKHQQQPKLAEVTGRIQEYCKTITGHELSVKVLPFDEIRKRQQIVIFEAHDPNAHPAWVGDEALPQIVKIILEKDLPRCKRDQIFLPREGHFVLDIFLTIPSGNADNGTDKVGDKPVLLQVDAYRHTQHGMKVIQKIKAQLEAEICRTNRRWRRKLKREQAESQTAGNDGLQTMDET